MKTIINIDDLIGVRYRNNGRDPKSGLDCYGLAIIICKRFGHDLPDMEGANKAEFIKYMNQCVKSIPIKEVEKPMKECDILLIKDTKGVLSHIGIYLGNGMFIHCNSDGVHLDKLSRYLHWIGRVYTWL